MNEFHLYEKKLKVSFLFNFSFLKKFFGIKGTPSCQSLDKGHLRACQSNEDGLMSDNFLF